MTASVTDAIASTTMSASGARSERISRRNRPADPRKFIDFSTGMPMVIIGPPPPGPRRTGGMRCASARAHAASSTLTCEYTISW